MRKIISGNKINMKEAETLVVDTYNLVNGWINPINRSESLTIKNVKSRELGGLAYMTGVVMNIGFLAIRNYVGTVKDILKSKDFKYLESNIETHIVALTIHELSHMDQDFLAYNVIVNGIEQENTYALEAANEVNTLNFIVNNKAQLEEKLDIKINAKWHIRDCVYNQFMAFQYVQIKNIHSVSNRMLRKFTGRNLDVLVNDVQKAGGTHILVKYKGEYYNPLEKEGLVALDNILGYSYKTYKTSCRIDQALGVKAMVIELEESGETTDYPYLVYWDYSGMVA